LSGKTATAPLFMPEHAVFCLYSLLVS
jgi:hypothetical protein